MFRRYFYAGSVVLMGGVAGWSVQWPPAAWSLVVLGPLIGLGLYDALQRRRAVLRNWPLLGRFRYLLEAVRPEIQQYFVEGNTDGTPFSREFRSVAYQRSKAALSTLPFGTQRDVYATGYEWMNHSLAAGSPPKEVPRVRIGGPDCGQPYLSSYLNISAMSFGSLSRNAILALNEGARRGGFAHNTGEGGLSPHHLERGGDLVWQIGTGYFGCRTSDGGFCMDRFREKAVHPAVKMVEIKLSQGAKPGHGGILPKAKLTPEIARIREVPLGQDVLSPPSHSAFLTPTELVRFIARIRGAAEGKPVGIKLCLGDPSEFLALCKAMLETGITPDFITVDGGEGGTGAAPVEFTNSVGTPLREGLNFVQNALVGTGLRDRLTVIASGKIITGFDLVRVRALGADLGNAARAMMFALGCIQARRCNSNDCPVGVATQNPALAHGLDIEDKAERVQRYHRETLHAFLELVSAAGLRSPRDIFPHHLWRRIDATKVLHYGQIYPVGTQSHLLDGTSYSALSECFDRARSDRFVSEPATQERALATPVGS